MGATAAPRRAPKRGGIAAFVLFGALAVSVAGIAPAAAAPTTTSSSTTTTSTTAPAPAPPTAAPAPPTPPTTEAPPPPAFPMPWNAGPKLLTEQRLARHDINVLRPELATALQTRDRLDTAWSKLLARLAKSEQQVRDAQHKLAILHGQVASLAAQAYTQGATQRVTAAVGVVAGTEDIVQASRDLVFLDRVGTHTTDVLNEYLGRKRELDRRVREMNAQRIELRGRLDNAAANADNLQHQYDDARHRLADSIVGLEQFREAATTSASPILGPSFLTASDLAAFVTARGSHPHLTVPLTALAKMYIEEGNKTGVRGDVAWAQSILETGSFGYAGSMVANTDNNFAGIGACDSCKHGFKFKTARLGVRAQMQLLRTYVDKSYSAKTARNPLVLPKTLKLGFRGKVHSWWDLGHHWATGANYGDHLYAIYMQMVLFAAHRSS